MRQQTDPVQHAVNLVSWVVGLMGSLTLVAFLVVAMDRKAMGAALGSLLLQVSPQGNQLLQVSQQGGNGNMEQLAEAFAWTFAATWASQTIAGLCMVFGLAPFWLPRLFAWLLKRKASSHSGLTS